MIGHDPGAAPNDVLLAGRDFLFGMAKLARRELDPVDNLILLGVSQANVRKIVAQDESQLQYAFADTNPGDDLRQPIRVAALSRTLGLAFETTRRRVMKLQEQGYLCGVQKGLLIPAAAFDSPAHLATMVAVERIVAATFDRLNGGGFFGLWDLPEPSDIPAKPPLRAIARLAGDHYLRILVAFREYAGDTLDALILLSVMHGARFHEPSKLVETGFATGSASPAISREFGLSSETVRRRLQRMVHDGLCEKGLDGYVVAPSALEAGLAPQLVMSNELSLRRLFRSLARLGVVAYWTAQLEERQHSDMRTVP